MARPNRTERREQILSQARDVFAEKGYHRTTIDDIAAGADVARGTFYLYFTDKRAVFEALVDEFFDRIVGAIRSVDVNHPTESPRAQLEANIRRLTELALAEPAMMKVLLYDTVGVDPDFDSKLRSFYAKIGKFLEESLEEGHRIGLVRTGDRPIMVALGLGGLKEILLRAVTGELPRGPRDLTDEIMRFLWSGLLAPD